MSAAPSPPYRSALAASLPCWAGCARSGCGVESAVVLCWPGATGYRSSQVVCYQAHSLLWQSSILAQQGTGDLHKHSRPHASVCSTTMLMASFRCAAGNSHHSSWLPSTCSAPGSDKPRKYRPLQRPLDTLCLLHMILATRGRRRPCSSIGSRLCSYLIMLFLHSGEM